MRDKTEEELDQEARNSKRLFWSTATNGNATNWFDALLLFIGWGIIVTVIMFSVFWVLAHLGSGEPYP